MEPLAKSVSRLYVKTEALENGAEENVIYCRSIGVFGRFVLVWTIGENVSRSMRTRIGLCLTTALDRVPRIFLSGMAAVTRTG